MHTDDEVPVTKQEDIIDESLDNISVRLDKSDAIKKEKKSDTEDPKPRIVLTFRSEKSGAKTSNMKIVSNEEKHEEISPRRSIRRRNTKKESEDDVSHVDSEDDELIETTPPKRFTRHHSKAFTDVIANAIARKASYYEARSLFTQTLSRRIKPKAKILANKELKIGLESQNNAHLGISADKSSEEGVRTRRSAQTRSAEYSSEKRVSKRKLQEESANDSSDKESDNSSKKLIHLCNLGLKVKDDDESSEAENRKTDSSANEAADDDEDEEIDDDTEVISKLLEADEESASDEDFCPESSTKRRRSRKNSSPAPLRRSSRKANSGLYYYDTFAFEDGGDSDYELKRKSTRSHGAEEVPSEGETEAKIGSDAAGAEEDVEAACPGDTTTVVATCLCEEPTNIYAAPSELKEPVFCQAVELVEGVRVGCSHALPAGAPRALLRAGPRAPYVLACRLHAAQLRRHMCCPLCGLFCTQGIFYQCSKKHLFHVECGIQGDAKQRAGCPHCGVHSYRWQPVNRDYVRVRVDMHCSNKRVFLPDQREQCTPAFLGFTPLDQSQLDQKPPIPEELLASMPSDLKKLFERDDADSTDYSIHDLYQAIIAGDAMEQLIPKIVSVRGSHLNEPLAECEGGTCAHAAAAHGRVLATCLLQFAGADLDAGDSLARTPLMRAILALLDKDTTEEAEQEVHEEESNDNKKIKQIQDGEDDEVKKDGDEEVEAKKKEEHDEETNKDEEDKTEAKEDDINEDPNKPNEEDFMKVIKYLLAAGCDVNKQGPEGMTALHMAAQFGGEAVCRELLRAGARPDARDHGGWTALVRAAEHKHAHVVRLLLESGADALASDNEGNLAVHWCALAGDARSLALLLRAAPAAAAAPNAHTDTPLHVAAREGHYACVIVLLAHGAKTDQENSTGELPVDVCSGAIRNAILLNMEMTMAVKDKIPRSRILCSDISKGREPFSVPCVNDVDDAPPPDDFTYVSQHVAPAHVPLDDSIETMQGCSCLECDDECACCVLGVRRWYRAGRLPAAFPYHDPPMLFECNQTCACDAKRCPNRVVGPVARGGSLAVPVAVYRTRRCGWGLRTRQAVPRGALVALYRGELLPHERADIRADDQYLFALDLKPDLLEQCSEQTQLCLDAARFGSAARFMNHSCRPSVAPVHVFTEARDLRLPHVALFALRDLRAGDPLTFDYGDKFWSVKSKWMKCECEAPDCKYPTKCTEEDES
ncbi:histone-lysine N-methyltransferase EHMT2 [Melitaea cinxia]|uniref:histone-lysine N-methyltransferase EHMT2 n=1 Tax=Melitaea cinxia TaxID=113334 RepID=UPI001E273C9B|nr:histone-lysine N-methyltransferase EHMT2 [Melitaea cinxia]